MMYVMQVTSGRELDACRDLSKKGYIAYAPEKQMFIRKGGKWRKEIRLLFAGYIFISTSDLRAQDYYIIKSCIGFIRLLGSPVPKSISLQEEKYILFLANNGCPLPPSRVYVNLDKEIEVASGPLKLFEAEITWFSRRQRRAQVDTEIAGTIYRLTFPVIFLGFKSLTNTASVDSFPMQFCRIYI